MRSSHCPSSILLGDRWQSQELKKDDLTHESIPQRLCFFITIQSYGTRNLILSFNIEENITANKYTHIFSCISDLEFEELNAVRIWNGVRPEKYF